MNGADYQDNSLVITSYSMANSISLLMENAVQAEANSQVVANASTAQCCAMMISVGVAKAASS